MTWRRKRYRRHVASLSCALCRKRAPSDAAHLGSSSKGMGVKSPDSFAVPLCRLHHDMLDGRHQDRLDDFDILTLYQCALGTLTIWLERHALMLGDPAPKRAKFGERKAGSRAAQSPKKKMGERR